MQDRRRRGGLQVTGPRERRWTSPGQNAAGGTGGRPPRRRGRRGGSLGGTDRADSNPLPRPRRRAAAPGRPGGTRETDPPDAPRRISYELLLKSKCIRSALVCNWLLAKSVKLTKSNSDTCVSYVCTLKTCKVPSAENVRKHLTIYLWYAKFTPTGPLERTPHCRGALGATYFWV